MKFLTFIFIAHFALALQAKEQKHHHDAHVHGAATVNIAFDGLVGKIEFKAAANGIVGFEHEAKTEKDKALLAKASDQFVNERKQIFKFDDSLNCVIEKVMVGLQFENETSQEKGKKIKLLAEHADFTASYNVNCKKSPMNSKLTLDFTLFKSLKDIDATILIGDLQKSVEIKSKPVSVELN